MKIFSFFVLLAIVALVASFGSQYMPGEWYSLIHKPSWTPPNWLFGPVWAVLYLLMTIAAWKVWQEQHPLSDRALLYWLVQLLLNGAWSWLFFGLNNPGLALIEMTVLIIAISATIRLFRRISLAAANMLTPYLIWVSFAWILNLAIWWMNGAGRKILGFFL
ncbi:MAG: benzodiazapine receptor [Lysobacterales bacterium]